MGKVEIMADILERFNQGVKTLIMTHEVICKHFGTKPKLFLDFSQKEFQPPPKIKGAIEEFREFAQEHGLQLVMDYEKGIVTISKPI